MLNSKQTRVVIQLHELEKNIGKLYALFAEKYPDQRELWMRLSQEEEGHAEALHKLYDASLEGRAVFEEGKISHEGVQLVIEHVRTVYRCAMQGKISALKALSIGYDLENSLLEKAVFQCFKVTSEFADMLQTLRGETQKHALLTKNEINACRCHPAGAFAA
jgi:hypothetical protein